MFRAHFPISLFCLFSLFSATPRANADDSLPAAQNLVSQGQNAAALQLYREAFRADRNLSSAAFYNFGTLALREGLANEAHAYLWRAVLTRPFDGDARENLRLAQEKLPPDTRRISPATWLSWWPEGARFFPAQLWWIASLFLFAPFFWRMARKGRIAEPWEWSLLGLASLTVMGALSASWQARVPVAGVLTSTKLLSGPGTSFPEITSLPGGAIVNSEEVRDGWTKVRYRDPAQRETVGWIESTTTLPLR